MRIEQFAVAAQHPHEQLHRQDVEQQTSVSEDHASQSADHSKIRPDGHEALPHSTLRIFDGQEHNAMDTIPQEFAATISAFLKQE